MPAEVTKALEVEVEQAERAGIEVAVRSFQAAQAPQCGCRTSPT